MGGIKPIAGLFAAALILLTFSNLAYGQGLSTQQVPTRDELQGITQPQAPAVPRLTVVGGTERSPCALADPQFADVKVTITQVTFNGLRGASEEDLYPAWQPFVGTQQPVAVLCEIRDAAATILRNMGYLAAAQVPAQSIVDGRVEFELIFGRITAVRARGETQGIERKLEQYLGQLADDDIFDRNRAERYLLLARDVPGYDVQLRLIPVPGEIGALIGEVTVNRQPFRVDAMLQNLGGQAVGPVGGQIRASLFGLTGMGDASSLSYFASSDFSEQHVVQAAHEFRPGSEGLTIAAQATYAWTRPDIGLAPGTGAELTAETLYASLSARYPLRRTQASSIMLSGGLDFVNQDVNLIVQIARDRLRVGWAKLAVEQIDTSRRAPRYQVNGSVEIRQGFDIFGAQNPCVGTSCPAGFVNPGRVDARTNATVIRAAADLDLALSSSVSLSLAPRAQISSAGLFGFEEFTAGSYGPGRGFDPGTIVGDYGLGLMAEVGLSAFSLSNSRQTALQPYLFGDAARVWNEDASGGQSLYSAGVGARVNFGSRFALDTLLAIPLNSAGLLQETPDPRLLFTLVTRIFP